MVKFSHKAIIWLQEIWTVAFKSQSKCTFAFASLENFFLKIKNRCNFLYCSCALFKMLWNEMCEKEAPLRGRILSFLFSLLLTQLVCLVIYNAKLRHQCSRNLRPGSHWKEKQWNALSNKLLVLVTRWYFIFTWLMNVSAGLPSKGVALAAHYTHRERTESPQTLKHKENPGEFYCILL